MVREIFRVSSNTLARALRGQISASRKKIVFRHFSLSFLLELSRLQTVHQQQQLLIQTHEKEMNILQLTTKQKDEEIQRLNLLNR